MTATRNYFAQSWLDENRQFSRRWTEPPKRDRRPVYQTEAAEMHIKESRNTDTTTWANLSTAILMDHRRGRAAA